MAKLPLEGIRVIDITLVWALPWAGLMLGDMGAEVIRVESIHHVPRLTRLTVRPAMRQAIERMIKSGTASYFMGAAYPNKELGEKTWERNAMFTSLHRSKLSVTMDLTRPKGMEMFKKLVKVSDIFTGPRVFHCLVPALNSELSSGERGGGESAFTPVRISRAC